MLLLLFRVYEAADSTESAVSSIKEMMTQRGIRTPAFMPPASLATVGSSSRTATGPAR